MLHLPVRLLSFIGELCYGYLLRVGRLAALLARIIGWICYGLTKRWMPFAWNDLVRQMWFVGVGSLPVIIVTGAFAGLVLAFSFYNEFMRLGVQTWTGPLVAKSLVLQLAPVLAALMVAGRVGTAMTAELGSMVVTEQVDALTTMGVSPVRWLAIPRVISFTLMMPVLTAWAIGIGIFSGVALTVWGLGAVPHYQMTQISSFMNPYDYVQGLTKSLVFGLIIGLVSCRRGLETQVYEGAEGVGKATTEANVEGCVDVLIMNFWLTMVLMQFDPRN